MQIMIKTNAPKQAWQIIRQSVFMEEQGFQNEFDAIDENAWHLVAYAGQKPVGCLRLYIEGADTKVVHLGRLAVLKPYRHRQIGAMLVKEAEQQMKQQSKKRVVLSAQCSARPFYEKMGYQAYGSILMDEGVPHISMYKVLS